MLRVVLFAVELFAEMRGLSSLGRGARTGLKVKLAAAGIVFGGQKYPQSR